MTTNKFNHWRAGLLLLAVALLPRLAWAEPLTVVTSVQPVYLIAKELLGDSVALYNLLPPGASPHGFQMNVSQRRRLEQADLLVWVGPGMENFLTPLVRHSNALELDTLAGIKWPEAAAEHQAADHDEHAHTGRDPHLWLSPANGQVIAEGLVAALTVLTDDAGQKADWAARLERFSAELAANDREWQEQLAPLSEVPWLVYHDALNHFQAHFQLHPYQVITRTPEQRPGARHLYELRQQLQSGQCLLVEEYYPTTQAERLAEEYQLTRVSFDPLGVEAADYTQLMHNLVDRVSVCLRAQRPAAH
ncbi:metal ABC transporter solute-binding protein, Zn/Mn family [Halioxenophilus sp. WMMB6]|uniref:metal ABC transporter solute-binding protein, Zn/Mn family n=1 Tax=Halioxenophilus sp. WMMB6 TaxID=3073815 RepID=UPI00295EC626|nr:zinc ABC transporter substrate-binding protein [Halioxenophilus sp. WMMB6]